MTGKTEFLNVAFDPLTCVEAERWIAARGAQTPFAYVVTLNVDHVVRLASAEADVHAAYAGARLTICDSRVLSRLAWLFGLKLPPSPGSDLVAGLFARVLAPDDTICVVGGTAANIARLRALYPRLRISHHEAPGGLRADAAARGAAARFAAETGARATLIAVGSPQQELIAHEIARHPGVRGTGLCIGAGVDFLVGAQRRAPRVVQLAGMEWALRLVGSPRRFYRRYLIEGPTIVPLVWRWRSGRKR